VSGVCRRHGAGPAVIATVLLCGLAYPAAATEWHVAPGGSGRGTAASPFGRIQQAIASAQPGDVVVIAAGRYEESLRTVRDGRPDAPITLRAAAPDDRPVVVASGRVFTWRHAYVVLDGLVLDGRYGTDDAVRIETAADGSVLRNCEVRNTSRDAIDIQAPADVAIERCNVHHALNAGDGRTDAHGIAAGAVRRLTIRDTEIHTFSGDGVQVDPGRDAPGWDEVTLERCRIWLAPLAAATNGFAAGVVPGENAVDTKASASFRRARLTVRDVEASGFESGLIHNMAAFNLKEYVTVLVDRVTVFDSEIAFRLRGASGGRGADVQISNAVIYSTGTAFRYEDGLQDLRVWNVTLGNGVRRPFQQAGRPSGPLDVRNLLVLGAALPAEALSGMHVAADAFAGADRGDYRLAAGSPASDAGESMPGVLLDRSGTVRPQGPRYDVGAYEFPAGSHPEAAPTLVVR
jgi:hypothetical protein